MYVLYDRVSCLKKNGGGREMDKLCPHPTILRSASAAPLWLLSCTPRGKAVYHQSSPDAQWPCGHSCTVSPSAFAFPFQSSPFAHLHLVFIPFQISWPSRLTTSGLDAPIMCHTSHNVNQTQHYVEPLLPPSRPVWRSDSQLQASPGGFQTTVKGGWFSLAFQVLS